MCVRADYRLIRQVLINLLTNAIKFSSEGSKIFLNTHCDENKSLIISVRDEGIGIPKDKIQQALEPFGQVSDSADTRNAEKQGTGLGLPLAKAMVEMHGGDFSIDSDLGKGTIVSFSLPSSRVLASKA